MTVRGLWLPYEVDDLDSARDFYTVHLGLSEVDSWNRPGERGVVLKAAGAAYVELVSPVTNRRPAPVAFELADEQAVDAAFARSAFARSAFARSRPAEVIAAPRRYPRGHYGFELRGPADAHVMVWSER